MVDPNWFQIAAMILGPSGVAAGTIKLVLNGSARRIKETQAHVSRIADDLQDVRERVANIEGRLARKS